MKLSSVYLLTGLVLFIIGTFAWQYIMYLQLKHEPLSCTGELYFANTCPIGQGCYYSPQSQIETPTNQNPDLNPAVQTIIDFQTGKSKHSGLGICQPWLNSLLKINN